MIYNDILIDIIQMLNKMFLKHSNLILILLSYLCIALALADSNGMYTATAITYLFLGICLWVVFVIYYTKLQESFFAVDKLDEALVKVALLVSASVGLIHAPLMYAHKQIYAKLYIVILVLLLIGVTLTFKIKKLNHPNFIFLFILFFILLRCLIPWASPSPIIDVFVQFQESAQHLLSGMNPYTTPVSDVYQGARSYGYQVYGYSYFPANLYLQTIAYALLHDIRYVYILMEIISGLLFYKLYQKTGNKIHLWIYLLLLVHPRGLFVLEQAWTEPLIVGLLALFAYVKIFHPQKLRLSALLFGYLISLKQYLVYFLLHYFFLERKSGKYFYSLMIIVLGMLPFVIWDVQAFIHYAVLFQLQTAFREDGLTFIAAFHRWFGFQTGKQLAGFLGLGVSLLTVYLLHRHDKLLVFFISAISTLLVMFAFGSQAFCNYYYLLSWMMMMFLSILLDRSRI